jgi:putative nucleotidyltransferase with HDIG domain
MHRAVVPNRPLIWPDVVEALRQATLPSDDLYIVGGAVRDAYLHRPLHDIDLATPRDGRPVARRIADHFGGVYYSLDPERGVGRAILPVEDESLTIDVAQFRGSDLNTDLLLRDFTANALAVQLAGDLQAVIDPLGGLDDLDKRLLRECNAESIKSDPVRVLRAIRTSANYGFHIEPSTLANIKRYGNDLDRVSVERLRDEFFQILDTRKPSAAITLLLHLGLIDHLMPEVAAMRAVKQPLPHQYDVLQHTLYTIEHLSTELHILQANHDDAVTANMQFGLLSQALKPYLAQLAEHISHDWPNGRTHRALLMLAALLHDSGKPHARSVSEDGRVHFHQHEQIGAQIMEKRAHALRLSNDEVQRLTTIVKHHMRPHWLHNTKPLTARAIYRFWRDTGPAGVDICLLAAADLLATYGPTLDTRDWAGYLETLQALLDSYFVHHDTAVEPPPLLTGHHLIAHLGLQPGPQIGILLEQVREAQVEGLIATTEEALEWLQRFLDTASQNN